MTPQIGAFLWFQNTVLHGCDMDVNFWISSGTSYLAGPQGWAAQEKKVFRWSRQAQVQDKGYSARSYLDHTFTRFIKQVVPPTRHPAVTCISIQGDHDGVKAGQFLLNLIKKKEDLKDLGMANPSNGYRPGVATLGYVFSFPAIFMAEVDTSFWWLTW